MSQAEQQRHRPDRTSTATLIALFAVAAIAGAAFILVRVRRGGRPRVRMYNLVPVAGGGGGTEQHGHEDWAADAAEAERWDDGDSFDEEDVADAFSNDVVLDTDPGESYRAVLAKHRGRRGRGQGGGV